MNQEKIGKFIQEKRKEKGLTQKDLAEKMGVSNRAVSKWESGISMPDLSLFKSLCDELGITINELYNGEVDKDKLSDENIVNTIELADKKHSTDVVGYLVFKVLGILLIIFGCSFINVKSIFPTLCLIIGTIFEIISAFKLTNSLKKVYKIVINIIYILIWVTIICIIDHVNVIETNSYPRLYLYHKKEQKYEVYYRLNYEYYYCGKDGILFEYFKHNETEKRNLTIELCNKM